jgi:hypothetical protein
LGCPSSLRDTGFRSIFMFWLFEEMSIFKDWLQEAIRPQIWLNSSGHRYVRKYRQNAWRACVSVFQIQTEFQFKASFTKFCRHFRNKVIFILHKQWTTKTEIIWKNFQTTSIWMQRSMLWTSISPLANRTMIQPVVPGMHRRLNHL